MKKKFYFATLVIAALSFTGCANDEYVGDQRNPGEQNGAIAFSTKSTNTVRAESTESTGKNAATKLHDQFWVYGWKTGSDINTPLVFNNYKVEYSENSTSPSNTKGWEYVGKGTNQTIKYWDYSASQYDFEAYSKTTGSVVRKDEGDYVVTQLNSPADLYFAQKNTMSKPADGGKYEVVTLKFQSVLSKIRVGFYETIPGYSVKIDRFYRPNNTGNPNNFEDASNQAATNFVAWCPNKAANTDHPFVVTYVTDNTSNPAVTTPTVTKVKDGSNYLKIDGTDGYTLNPQLTLGTNLLTQNQIGETSSAVTWDNIDVDNNKPIYTYFIPQNKLGGGKVQPMKIKVDYTLTSTDGSKEEIHVKGATAIVPAEYLMWKPNTAYSYVFKISDNTNGTTGTPGTPSDPVGLYPITFDAVVTEMEKNDYLTTVSDLSITATQGKQFAEADKAAFNTDQEIKVKVMRYINDVASDITSENTYHFYAAFVSDYKYDKSQEDNLNGKTLEPKNPADGNNYIKLDGQTNAGFWIVKVTYKDGDETITKYAVLKVGIETPSTSGNG